MQEAIDHALAARDFEHVAQLLAPLAEEVLVRQGAVAQLLRWLTALPAAMLDRQPHLRLMRAFAGLFGYDTQQLESDLQRLAQIPALPPEIQSGVALIEASLLRLQGDHIGAKVRFRQALALVPADYHTMRLALQTNIAGILCSEEENWQEASAILTEVIELGQRVDDHVNTLAARNMFGWIAQARGKLHCALAIYQDAVQWAAGQGRRLSPYVGMTHLGLAGLFTEWNDLKTAAEHYTQAMYIGEQSGYGDILWWGYQE